MFEWPLIDRLETLSQGKKYLLAAGALVVLMLAAYSNSFSAGFHLDDFHQVVDNHNVRGLENLPRFFTDAGMGSYRRELKAYRPLTYASFAVNYALAGYKVLGYHAVNLAIHIINAFLVFLIAKAVMRKEGSSEGLYAALAASLVFALHPVQTGAVTYISGRAVLLAGLFVLLSFYAFLRFRTGGGAGWAASAPAFFLFGLFSKEAAVSLLALMLAYDLIFSVPRLGGIRRSTRTFLYYLPFLAVLLAYLAARKYLQGSFISAEIPYGVAGYLMSEAKVFLLYARLLLLPVNQNVDYGLPLTVSVDYWVALSALVLAASVMMLFRLRRKEPAVSFFGFWALLTLLPESSLVPITDIVVEYRLYLPSTGFAAAAVLLLSRGVKAPALRRGMAITFMAVFLVLTFSRNAVWATELSLWTDAASKSPRSARARASLGSALMDEGRYKDAVGEFEAALGINPLDPQVSSTYNNLGICYGELGRPEDAAMMFEKVLGFEPGNRSAYANLGMAYLDLGRYSDSLGVLTRAARLFPDFTDARYDLAMLYVKLGRLDEAVAEMEEARKYAPMDFEINCRLAELYYMSGMADMAAKQAGVAAGLAAGGGQRARAEGLLSELEGIGQKPGVGGR